MVKQTVLCVDDELDNVEALERLLRPKYQVLTATSAKDALALIDQSPAGKIAAIISDQRMPEMTGVELFRETLKKIPETSRILLTGYTDIESIISAVNAGEIFRYLTKPWDPVDLIATVDSAVERHFLTRELKDKNAALNQALEDLKSLDRMKTEFMLLMGHELRTPLTSILNFSDLLRDEVKSSEHLNYIDHILKSAQRLESLTKDILFLLEVSAGQVLIQKSQIQLKPFVEKIVSRFDPGRIHLQVIDAQLIGDFKLVERALGELLKNALAFSSADSTIEVRGQRVGPHRIQLSVINAGPPLSTHIIRNLNSAFVVDKNLLHHSKGPGLGLSMVSAIVKAHGSELKIDDGGGQIQASFVLPDL